MFTMRHVVRWTSVPVLVLAIVVVLTGSDSALVLAQENAVVIPPPAADAAAGQKSSEVAVLAGGCFWGVQGVYQHLKGVTAAVSGYAGGQKNTAEYEIVGHGNSGHAESVQITFDPRQVSYGRLLQVFFAVVHDPTQLNRQGPDVGPQYRSAIFPANPEQDKIARAYIAQLNEARVFKAGIVTKIEPDRSFFPAEDYHQDFLTKNPGHPYIVINDLPKIEALKKVFTDRYRSAPVLVGSR
jgi:peptide-methionine (S)-S-oxide reductase